MKRFNHKILVSITLVISAMLLLGCAPEKSGSDKPQPAAAVSDIRAYDIRSDLKEMTLADPEKGIGVYGRYTELTAEGDVPEVLSKTLSEVNERAKEAVENKAKQFLEKNDFPVLAAGSAVTDHYRYRNISQIVNVTRADSVLFSILETEMEGGIGDANGEWIDETQTCIFHSFVYDTKSGKALTLADFLQNPDSLNEQLEQALLNKYSDAGIYIGGEQEIPAWTADYLGLRFYLDGEKISDDYRQNQGSYSRKAVHVSVPYSALDGPFSETAAATPESFIAQIEKNTEYALPYDNRTICVEKAENSYGSESYRIVIQDEKGEKGWWLEYADDDSDYYVFRARDGYYFYRLEDMQDRAYVYNFASPDGGFDRFENQNAQCFDSFLHELYLAVPYNPDCVHMRERLRKFMDSVSGLNTSYAPNGHYAFLPEQGRGRTWLHFSLIDNMLALDSRNIGCRLLHEINAAELDEEGNEAGETVIPVGEVLRFLRVDEENELYYYMSTQYYMHQSNDYQYDCMLTDGRQVRLVNRLADSFYVDGMYLDRIAEPVTLGAAQYEAGQGSIPEHFVEIGGKEYKLITDLSLKTESGEEIDFDGDIWWKVENYVGTFLSEDADAELIISEDGEASFKYDGTVYTGKLPEKRYYRTYVQIPMEAQNERGRTFQISVKDNLPWHDPSFKRIELYSEGEPATNMPSDVPPIEAELVRKN